MFVVLASAHDEMARAMCVAWAPWGCVLCVPADLSQPGWSHQVGQPATSTAVLGGRVTPASEISGVLTRLWHVPPEELRHIASADRGYVAAEMTAFLIAFLTDLRCVVLNRPAASALSGPGWRREQWVRAAMQAGIPAASVHKSAGQGGSSTVLPPVGAEVTVVGELVFGTTDANLMTWSRQLAAIAGVELLGVQFARRGGEYVFAGVSGLPALTFPGALDAVRELLVRQA